MIELGLTEAIVALQLVREQLGAQRVLASVATRHGDVEIEVDADGHALRVNGVPVPQGLGA